MTYSSKGPFSQIILDEIALEGLEGVTIPSLWVYLANALELPLPLDEQLQNQVWSFILKVKHLSFYELPEERPVAAVNNRFEDLDPLLGIPVEPDICPFNHYKYAPVQEENIFGSCETYKTRRKIQIADLYEHTVDDVLKKWGNKFVIVASQELRFHVLTPVNTSIIKDMTPVQYCTLELIGRTRYNGITTAGNWSLQEYCKDSTIVFYIKNKLVRFGLVAIQPYTEKRKDRVFVTSLLTLPRFYLMHKNMFNLLLEQLIEALKKSPKNRITVSDAHKFFPAIEKPKAFRKVVMTHDFRRIFEIVNVPVLEAADVIEVPKYAKKERMVSVLRLRNPNITFKEVFVENEAEKEEKEETVDFCSDKHSFVDMPIREEFYRAIERHGATGCSHTDICNYTGMHHYNVRQLVKIALKLGLITSYYTDVGRQRTNMYVAIQHSHIVKEKKKETTEFLRNMICTEEPITAPKTDILLQDIPSIFARVKPHEFKKCKRQKTTVRQLQRRALIVKTIDERCIVILSDLRHILQNAEKEKGYLDEICQKSVRRLLSHMVEGGIVKTYEVALQCEDLIRIHRFVTHPKIEPEHEIIQKEVIKLKNHLYLAMEERRVRMRNKPLKTASKPVEQRKEILTLSSYASPKFLIARHLHEFLFYLRYELNNQIKPIPITEQLLQQWKQTEPTLAVQEYYEYLQNENESLVAYSTEINWRTFIPPLPTYEGKPIGWLLFIDAVERLPLSIFNKIFRLNKCADERIYEYLNHPIRQHYLIKQLPCDVQCCISRARLQIIYINILKLLYNLGLVQVSERTVKDPLRLWVYLNKRAQILDTTSTEPSYSKINPDRMYTALDYEFLRFDDVAHYWTTLQHICVHTPLGFRKGKAKRKPGKNPEITFLSTINFDDAESNDLGSVPGDRLGAGGLSSHLFSHTFRNWSWIVQTKSKPKPIKVSRLLHPSRYKISKQLVQNRKNVQRGRRVSVEPLKRLQVKSAAKRTAKYVKKKEPNRDAIDRDALKNMRHLRASWRKEEDEILKMARATYMFIGTSTTVFNLINVARIVRDILRHSLGIYNKTTQAVMRRGTFLIKMNRHLPEMPAWLHFLQTNEFIQRKYGEDVIMNLKKIYPNKTDFLNALNIHFILILTFLYKSVKNNEEIVQRPQFIIPDSVAEFIREFKECTPVQEGQTILYHNPESIFDLQRITVISVLHSSLCCSRDKTLYNLQAFEIYKNFSEDVLNASFQKARSDGLIVAIKRKNLHVVPSHLAGPAYLFSQKYRLRLSYLKIPYFIYDIIFASYSEIFQLFFGSERTEKREQKYFELKSPNAGHFFLISEGLAINRWDLNFKLPVNILTVDVNQRQRSTSDRNLDSFFDTAPLTEQLEKEMRIKFHPTNVSYKISYNPYDIISKLPSRYLHFFCALDHLNDEVDINFSKLLHTDKESDVLTVECPFSCIMKYSNYINAIDRIVQEKKLILRELKEMPAQKLLNLAATESTVILQTSNLLTLVRMFESFFREKELQLEKKDLGKTATTLKSTKCVDWHQLCEDILEYSSKGGDTENIDEFELSKEERIVKAQDAFVINLPTLQLNPSPELKTTADFVSLGKINVPKSIAQTIIEREVILNKVLCESHWKYTENSLEGTIEPILQERNFSDMERQHLHEIHDFIQNKSLGVSALKLMEVFPYKFLFRALQILSEFFIIKRVGVSSFMYVHKLHIRPWVVHTFHIKRLQRENLGSTSKVLKRKHEAEKELGHDDSCDDVGNEDTDAGPSTSKKLKLAEDEIDDDAAKYSKLHEYEHYDNTPSTSNKITKRISKAITRFDSGIESAEVKSEVIKDVIAMKPQPWVRLNGSLNRRVLDKWIGSILIECTSRTGCFVHDIFLRFPHMLPADIMFLLELLCDLGSICLKQWKACEANLLSEYEFMEENEICATELYNPEQTYIVPLPDALSKLAIFIGDKKYNSDFF